MVMFVALRRVQQHNLRGLHAQRRSSSNAYKVFYLSSSSFIMSLQHSCMPKMIDCIVCEVFMSDRSSHCNSFQCHYAPS